MTYKKEIHLLLVFTQMKDNLKIHIEMIKFNLKLKK